jgi:hypothetical protein
MPEMQKPKHPAANIASRKKPVAMYEMQTGIPNTADGLPAAG